MNNRGQGGTVGSEASVLWSHASLPALVWHPKASNTIRRRRLPRKPSCSTRTIVAQSPPAYEEHEHKGAEYAGCEKEGAGQQGERSLEEGDEEQWDVDDAQDKLTSEAPNPKNCPFKRDPKKTTQHFIDDYPAPQGIQQGKLPLPVVLPQRRPKDRTRGFIRAYAPDLMNCGIDQAMFLDFLETCNLASQSSPWLNAINMAGIAFMHLPTGISQVASLALMLTVRVAKNMQSRHRCDFLPLDRLSGYLLTFFPV